MSDLGGVWRTVGGRRIFIKDGEDLETAMKRSGKFKKNYNEEDYKRYLKNRFGSDDEDFVAVGFEGGKQALRKDFEKALSEYDKAKKDWINSPFGDEEERMLRERIKNEAYNKLYGKPARNMEESIRLGEHFNRKALNSAREDVKAFLSGKVNYDGSREAFIRDLSNEWGIDIIEAERRKHPRNFKR